jgi:hypothetical protein
MSGPVYGGGAWISPGGAIRGRTSPQAAIGLRRSPPAAAALLPPGAGCSTCCHPLATLPADEVNAVVLDIGTYQVKAGYAGEDAPKYVFPSVRRPNACCLPLLSSLLPLGFAGSCTLGPLL